MIANEATLHKRLNWHINLLSKLTLTLSPTVFHQFSLTRNDFHTSLTIILTLSNSHAHSLHAPHANPHSPHPLSVSSTLTHIHSLSPTTHCHPLSSSFSLTLIIVWTFFLLYFHSLSPTHSLSQTFSLDHYHPLTFTLTHSPSHSHPNPHILSTTLIHTLTLTHTYSHLHFHPNTHIFTPIHSHPHAHRSTFPVKYVCTT